ncbi:MAG: hemopexin repeat-containing protein [Acidobacteriota bacterium]
MTVTKIDSLALLPNGETYATDGDQYVRYSDDNGTTVDPGYPVSIEGRWGNLPAAFDDGFDSMATLPNGKTYVTKGDQYARYSDDNATTVDPGYPVSIKGRWGNLPDAFNDGFDSMATLPNGKTYVTKGDQYVRYSDDDGTTIDPGYPRPIAGAWGDLPAAFNQGFDAMSTLPNGKTYVIKGDQYVRYSDDDGTTVDDGYPLPVKGNWG